MAEYIIEITDLLYNEETGEICTMPKFVGKLIRCKDCKWWLDSDHTCHEHSLVSPMTANDFCSRAERRSDDGV